MEPMFCLPRDVKAKYRLIKPSNKDFKFSGTNATAICEGRISANYFKLSNSLSKRQLKSPLSKGKSF